MSAHSNIPESVLPRWSRGALVASRPSPAAGTPRPQLQRRTQARGFALLIVVVLLAFVVVLVIGLAAYTRIESAIAGNTQRQAQARQNALLGLNVALAQLQKNAGPDQRATATAESFAGVNAQKKYYTGVWHSDTTQTANATTPLAWLVSGAEAATPAEDVTAAIPSARAVQLAGAKSAGAANSVVAPAQDITATGVPGATGPAPAVIGRYAWWVGDQGVKAPVAVADRSAKVNYDPFGDGSAQNELGKRLRQQIALGAAASDGTGALVFDPSATGNASLLANDPIVAHTQLAFVKNGSNAAVGLKPVQTNFHAWSPNNFAVLADTKLGGLRQDLSLNPGLLGAAFSAWQDYPGYMEDFTAAVTAPTTAIVPAYGPDATKPDPLRRRYRITPPVAEAGGVAGVAPVLSFFFIQFNVRRIGGNAAAANETRLEVRARMVTQLWNPYTSALVPEPLRLEVSGLPNLLIGDSNGGFQSADLQALFGGPDMRIELPSDDVAFPGDPDDASWLPGRCYYWRTKGGSVGAWSTEFYNRTLAVRNEDTWVVPTRSNYLPPGSNSVTLTVVGPPTQLTVKLRRASDNALLSTSRSPLFSNFTVDPQPMGSNDEYRFGYPIRLTEPTDVAASGGDGGWLTTPGADPRARVMDETLLRFLRSDAASDYVGNGGNSDFTDPGRLLDRVMGSTGMSYNEDVPVFELPRAPLLSLGALQHFQLEGQRPFAIGNSWGTGSQLNGVPVADLFDRFFLSGLSATAASLPGGTTPLPNPLLRLRPRDATSGAPITVADFQSVPDARSSKFLLQGGAFNLNSTNPAAWISVLRGIRFSSGGFSFLDADAATGSAADDAVQSITPNGACFFRFPQSAQEVFKADDNYEQSPGGSGVSNHAALYRRGMRALTNVELTTLANKIVAAIKTKQAASGPFRSLNEFLSPAAGTTASLLEQAIADAGLNAAVAEFSSQWLTQGDIMTALAPVLFPRSDTFVIRAYGEAVNPATGGTEGRAWCEATVQRMPEYFDPADAAEVAPAALTSELNKTYGRRFKVVSFRWLTRSDI